MPVEAIPLKSYPVIAQILLPLEGHTIITYRAGVVTRHGEWVTDYRVLHRFIMEYKGPSYTGTEATKDLNRSKALNYLRRKKLRPWEGKVVEDLVEVIIDLRESPLTQPSAIAA